VNPLLNTPNGTTFNCIIFFVLTNMYGHPAPVVVDRLQRNETKLFLTMESGMIWVEEIEGKLVVGRYWK